MLNPLQRRTVNMTSGQGALLLNLISITTVGSGRSICCKNTCRLPVYRFISQLAMSKNYFSIAYQSNLPKSSLVLKFLFLACISDTNLGWSWQSFSPQKNYNGYQVIQVVTKSFYDRFCRFDALPDGDKQTKRQTDRRTCSTAYYALRIASRW